METLQSQLPDLELVPPDIERDAPLGVKWLEGETGRHTLRLMGVTDEHNKPSSLEEEKERVKGFLDSNNQLTWMIKFQERIVGTIWVTLDSTEYLPGPSLHIMIGDPSTRGHGVGKNSTKTVIDYLRSSGNYDNIYSRHMMDNEMSEGLLSSVGFEAIGDVYKDKDGLAWQNELLELTEKQDKVKIEIASVDDAEAIAYIQRDTWLDTYTNEEADITEEDIKQRFDSDDGLGMHRRTKRFKKYIESLDNTHALFVAKKDNKVVGFIMPSPNNGQQRIGALYVLPEAQGYGAGSQLLQKAIDWYGRDNDIFLHAASFNQKAIEFYKKFGFKETGKTFGEPDASLNGKVLPEIEMVLAAK